MPTTLDNFIFIYPRWRVDLKYSGNWLHLMKKWISSSGWSKNFRFQYWKFVVHSSYIFNQGCNKSLPLCFNTWSFKLFRKEELNLEASWLGLTEGDWPKLQFSFSLWFIPSIFSDTSKTEEGLLRWKNSTWLWRALGWENDFLQDAQANGFSILESIFWWVHFEVFWITECFVNKTNLYFVNKVKLLRDATD